MKTYENLTENLFGLPTEPSTSSVVASPVRTFPALESELVSKVRDLVSGRNTDDSFATFDLASSSWRTWQLSLDGDLVEFSETFPRSGTMQSGTVSQLRPSAPLIRETASGLWATPQARDHFPPHSPEYIAEKRAQGHGMRNLNDEAAMWPTPRAQSANGSGPSRVGNKADLQTRAGGKLNPTWVEWLMGYPLGWTDLGASETQSSRKSQKCLEESSLPPCEVAP